MPHRGASGGAGRPRGSPPLPRSLVSSSRSSSSPTSTMPSSAAHARNTSRSPAVSTKRRPRRVAATSEEMTTRRPSPDTGSVPRRLRSNGDRSQPLITPSSPQEVQRHSIVAGTSVRNTARCPTQGRRPGRRRQGRALTHATPGSPAVAARTMSVRCSAIRRAGDGTSVGRSRKWRRSETNTGR